MSLSYRNQSTHLQSKPIDWYLYERDIGRYGVKKNFILYPIMLKGDVGLKFLKIENCCHVVENLTYERNFV